MTTLSQDVPQMDLIVHRGADEQYCCRWTVDNRDGKGYVPKDLTDWRATFKLESNGRTFFTTDCKTDSYGYAIAKVPGASSEGSNWDFYQLGTWRMDARGPEGERELLGWGNYELAG